MKFLLVFLISFAANAENIHDCAYMVSKIENTEIKCNDSGDCTVSGEDTEESIRIMVEVVGPELKRDGWNGEVRIKKI